MIIKLAFGIAAAIAIVVIGVAIRHVSINEVSAVVGLPMLSVGAVIVLIVLLCAMAVVFASFNLEDKSQALALPEGSIRAVIALMLIVLFAILTIYLFGSISTGQLAYVGVLDEAARAALAKAHGERNVVSTPDGNGFKVWLRLTASPEGVDFAKQLLILVGTLVTSISSFYFGAKTVGQSNDRTAVATLAPVVDALTPANYSRSNVPKDFALVGSNLERVTGLKFSLGGKLITATEVKAVANQVRFKLNFQEEPELGNWQIKLIDSKLGDQPLAQTLTVVL